VLALPGATPYYEGMSPLSGVLGEAWALYKRYAAHFIAISFSVYLVIAVVSALLSWALGSVGALIGLILTVFGAFLLQAALVKAVQDVRDGPAFFLFKSIIAVLGEHTSTTSSGGLVNFASPTSPMGTTTTPGIPEPSGGRR
jgi:hypothetical protein